MSLLRRMINVSFSIGLYVHGIQLIVVTDAHYPPPASTDTEELPTLDSYAKKKPAPVPALSNTQTASVPAAGEVAPAATGGAGDLEAEASQQGAFNEETGEINWDCPCLGGMAHGPCGEDFKAAFSCFVYSQEEPKGVDCIDKFKAMQDCFRAHPDIYGAELEDDEEGASAPEGQAAPALARDEGSLQSASGVEAAAAPVIDDVKEKITDAGEAIKDTAASVKDKVAERASSAKDDIDETASIAKRSVQQEKGEVSESEELVPKAAHDATDANKAVGTKSKA